MSTPAADSLALMGRQGHARGVAEDQLLERDAGAESEGPAAQPADRAGGDLQDPGAAVVDPELGVDRALGQADRRRGGRGRPLDQGQALRRQPRRGHVDRLGEVRPVQRVRLVEDRQDLEPAVPEQALDGDLQPRG